VVATAFLLNRLPDLVANGPSDWLKKEAFAGLVAAAMFERGTLPPEFGIKKAFDDVFFDVKQRLETQNSAVAGALTSATETRKSLEEFRSQFRTEVEADKVKLKNDLDAVRGEAKAAHRATLDSSAQQVEELTRKTHEALAVTKKQADDGLSGTRNELNALTDTYDDKMALSAPVTYWTERRQEHLVLAIVFGSFFAISLGVGGWLLVSMFGSYLPETVSSDKIPLGKIAESAVVLTFGIWMIRTLARIFFSNLHLSIDAGQRAIMVQTYLALLREKAGLDAEGKKLMIEAMFRPTSTGIVKDDANPPWAWASVFKGKGD